MNLWIYFKNIFKPTTNVLFFKPKHHNTWKVYIHKNLNKKEKLNNKNCILTDEEVQMLFYRFIKEHGLYYAWRNTTFMHTASDNYMFYKYHAVDTPFYHHLKHNRKWLTYKTLWTNILKTIDII